MHLGVLAAHIELPKLLCNNYHYAAGGAAAEAAGSGMPGRGVVAFEPGALDNTPLACIAWLLKKEQKKELK